MAGEDVHMAGVGSNVTKHKRQITMDSAILDAFPKLANGNDSIRHGGGMTLLKHLHEQSCCNIDGTEFKYALSRIIRGLGSSKTVSRKGYYTTLTSFLTLHPEISMETILSKVDHELKPKDSNSKSESAEIYMGRILAYGAMIRSKLLLKHENEVQLDILQKLMAAGNQRSYLYFVSLSFLIDYISQVDCDRLKSTGWPVIEKELGKEWSEYTLDTLYLLLIMKDKFPSLVNQKFLKKHLGVEDILDEQSMENLVKVLTDLPRIVSCYHPVFKLYCMKLNTTELISKFWTHMDKRFEKPSKSDEHVAIELLKLILQNAPDKSALPHLLTPNFLSHVLKKLSHFKKQSESNDIPLGFKNILSLFVLSVSDKDVKTKIKLGVLRKLILYPGDLMIEKKTGVKVIQPITASLNLDGIKKLSKNLREIIENTIQKERKNDKLERVWTNAERIYAAQLLSKLLGHPETISDHEWRLKQLQFLFTYGLCEISNVGTELAPQFKESFFRALDNKLPKLTDLRNILSSLVHYLDSGFKSNKIILRNPLSQEASDAWNRVIMLIGKWEKQNKKTEALPVFHTMNLHMGLQLFSDADMAVMSINELQSCYERLITKTKKQKLIKKRQQENEPEWVEVVIDLILSLLSRNNHLLRSLVGCTFPHICPYVTPTAIHQILAVFDVKNEKGPLVEKADLNGENDDDDDEKYNSEEQSDSDYDTEDGCGDSNEEATENSSGASDSDEDNGSLDDDENDTVTDRLRQAVSQALGDATIQTEDDDVDVDNMGDEEGKRLNESLAAAFKILRENRRSQPKKQEKSAQTVMHFRVRAIDLLESYLENNPSMAVTLDMVVPLFALLEYCIKESHQMPLQHRVRSCLKKLSSVKKFRDTDGVDNELIMIILKNLIDKGDRTTSVCQEMSDKLVECCIFLVKCAQQVGVPSENLIQVYGESLTSFFKKRDCILPPILFKNILQLHWDGNWELAPLLVDFAFDCTVRPFRRAHALEFLTVFYNNNRLVYSDEEHISVRTELERKLCRNTISMFTELSNTHKDSNEDINSTVEIRQEVKQRYICILLNLLRIVYNRHVPNAWNWKEIGKALTDYTSQAPLAKDAKSAYNKLSTQLGVPTYQVLRNKTPDQSAKLNGHAVQDEVEEAADIQESDSSQNGEETVELESNNDSNKKKKNKSKQKEKQHLKKEARLLREKTMSEGFETFQFSSFTLPDIVTDENEEEQNGNEQSEENTLATHKRQRKHSSDIGSKPKKKRVIQTA